MITWPNLYHKGFVHLCSGAWFEQVEIDFGPRYDDSSLINVSIDTYIVPISNRAYKAVSRAHRS
jgi:hypothetical protein